MKAINKKKGTVYTILGKAINCTNAQDGQTMIIYTNTELVFVREEKEFYEKFELIEVDPNNHQNLTTFTEANNLIHLKLDT